MSEDRPKSIALTAPHRRVLLVLLCLLTIYTAGRMFLNRTYIGDPQPARPLRELELADRIDPNTADVATLAALPGLGMKRAADIVRYRDEFQRQNPGRRAFERAQDLLKIRGIGYAMMTQLAPYLLLPDPAGSSTAPSQSATAPAS
jgi:hypothetical protein